MQPTQHRVATRHDLRNDTRLVLVAPLPPTTPAPVKTSSRRTGSVIAVCTVSILSLTVETEPQTRSCPVIR